MQISKYIISASFNEVLKLLFCTRTSKFVFISTEKYQRIFKERNFSLDLPDIKYLCDNGFLVEDGRDEAKELENVRRNVTQALNNGITTNYVITPTMDCNARCYYCFEEGAHHDYMTIETAEEIVKFIAAHHGDEVVTIHWFGGEPLINTSVIDYISTQLEGNKINFISKVTTNGFALTEDMLIKAKNLWRVTRIQITIDDLEEKYDNIKKYIVTCDKSPFFHILDNIGLAIKTGIRVRIRINYNPNEIEKVWDIMDYLMRYFDNNAYLSFHPQALFVDNDQISSITSSFSKLKTHPFIRLREFESEYRRRKKHDDNLSARTNYDAKFVSWCNYRVMGAEDTYSKILKKYYLYPIPIHCAGVCDQSLAIDSQGDIYTCQRQLGQGPKFASGNVKAGIIRNDIYNYFQSIDLKEVKCQKCNLLPLCQGGCKFKRMKYKSNQDCLPIKGVVKKAILHAAAEVEQAGFKIKKL